MISTPLAEQNSRAANIVVGTPLGSADLTCEEEASTLISSEAALHGHDETLGWTATAFGRAIAALELLTLRKSSKNGEVIATPVEIIQPGHKKHEVTTNGLSRRDFIKYFGIGALTAMVVPMEACTVLAPPSGYSPTESNSSHDDTGQTQTESPSAMESSSGNETYLPTIEFPKDAGHINVLDHGVDNTGNHDCTAKLQALISNNLYRRGFKDTVLYFPAGTYLISDTLYAKGYDEDLGGADVWLPGLTFQGENRDTTILKMKDGVWASGSYTRSDHTTKSMVLDGTYDALEGNNAFNNYFYDMTFDIGRNPAGGCLGPIANNYGAVRRCKFIGKSGHISVDFGRAYEGPCMVADCEFGEGFAVPPDTNGQEYTINFAGCHFANTANGHALETSIATVLERCTADGLVVNTAPSSITILWDSDTIVVDNKVGGYVKKLNTGSEGFNLEPLPTPNVPYEVADKWVNLTTYAGGPQAALDSGAHTFYIPVGANFGISGTLVVPSTAERIICMGQGPVPENWDLSKPFFKAIGSSDKPLIFERSSSQPDAPNGIDQNRYIYLEHDAARTVAFIDWGGFGIIQVNESEDKDNPRSLILDNTTLCSSMASGTALTARQLNCEDPTINAVTNDGGEVIVIGLKTEWGCPNAQLGNMASFGACWDEFVPTIIANGGETNVVLGWNLPNSGTEPGKVPYKFRPGANGEDPTYAMLTINYLGGGSPPSQMFSGGNNDLGVLDAIPPPRTLTQWGTKTTNAAGKTITMIPNTAGSLTYSAS